MGVVKNENEGRLQNEDWDFKSTKMAGANDSGRTP